MKLRMIRKKFQAKGPALEVKVSSQSHVYNETPVSEGKVSRQTSVNGEPAPLIVKKVRIAIKAHYVNSQLMRDSRNNADAACVMC